MSQSQDVLEEQILENNDDHDFVETSPGKKESGNDNNANSNNTCLVEKTSENVNNDNDVHEPFVEEEISDIDNNYVFVVLLFVDPMFPANDRSLYPFETQERLAVLRIKQKIPKVVEWKRPHEIVHSPQFIAGRPSRFDVIQGQLENCWLLAAIAVIAEHEDLFGRVVPTDQRFDEDYKGKFHFQFWHFGDWVDIVIDDRLPTVGGKLIYSQLPSNNAFWSVLLEKAYAKLHGGYANLDGGHTVEGLQDFTGGLTCPLWTNSMTSTDLLPWLKRGLNMGSLYGATIHPQNNEAGDGPVMENGLTGGHSYSVTALLLSKEVKLIRLRDPWGNDRLWNGSWSVKSKEWTSLDQAIKNHLTPPTLHDGEFWMSFNDFWENFHQIDVCHLKADIYNEMAHTRSDEKIPYLSGGNGWIQHHAHGEWSTAQGTAGGDRSCDSHHLNPQYRIKTPPLPDANGNDKVNVIVALTQKNSRKMRSGEPQNVHIGFYVYEVATESTLGADFFQNKDTRSLTSTFINFREISEPMEVNSGEYVIVPCTHAPNVNAKFLLRVFSDRPVEIRKLSI